VRAASRSIFGATVAAVVGFAILIGLGTWQLQRKAWKENLIATLTARLAAAPQALPPQARWPALDADEDEYRRVSLHAEFQPGQSALVYAAASAFRPDVSGTGYWVFAPAHLPGGGTVVVNRGFVPNDRKDQTGPSGPADLVGVLRWPEHAGLFTPAPSNGLWFARDPAAIAAAKNWGPVAPFYVEQESPQRPDAPQVGRLVVRLPNNHLQYVITWYGLAAALAGVYLAWLRGRLRRW
jgi:surfeit locus 1 family protein